jgi:hypothetical protein
MRHLREFPLTEKKMSAASWSKLSAYTTPLPVYKVGHWIQGSCVFIHIGQINLSINSQLTKTLFLKSKFKSLAKEAFHKPTLQHGSVFLSHIFQKTRSKQLLPEWCRLDFRLQKKLSPEWCNMGTGLQNRVCFYILKIRTNESLSKMFLVNNYLLTTLC